MTTGRNVLPRVSLLLAAASSSMASALRRPPPELHDRASACAAANFAQCTEPGLPDSFCCPTGQACIPLAGNTTAVCCPAGSDCTTIQPIPCDMDLEDKSKNPANVVMTTALSGTLPHCGNGTCCPFGYSCNSKTECEMDKNQNAVPIQSTGGTTSTTRPTSTATGTSTASNTISPVTSSSSPDPSSSSSAPATDAGTSSGPSAGAVTGGIIGGVAGLVLLAIIAFILFRRRRGAKRRPQDNNLKLTRSTSSFGNIINNPIANGSPGVRSLNISRPIMASGGVSGRTDFGRKTESHAGSPKSFNQDVSHPGSGNLERGSVDLHSVSSAPTGRAFAAGQARPPRVGGYGGFDNADRGDLFERPTRMPRVADYGGDDGYAAPSGNPHVAVSPATPTTTNDGNQSGRGESTSMSIDVFVDQGPSRASRASGMTTFSDMMERADLSAQLKGQPFLSPASKPGSSTTTPSKKK